MRIPGFTADASLYTATVIFNDLVAEPDRLLRGQVLPQCCEVDCEEFPNGRYRCFHHCYPGLCQ
jgi:hypothetical protein